MNAARFVPGTVGVIGGGTAGYFAALALKRAFPRMSVTLVESRDIPIIGVGEATTTLMPPFLHHQLGLDVVELFRAVRPTFKLGIKFAWGPPDVQWFGYPFGDARPIDSFAHERDLRRQSMTSLLMRDGRAPLVREPDGVVRSVLSTTKFAYHLDNAPFVAFLARKAIEAGIEHIDATIREVRLSPSGEIDAAVTNDGRKLEFDLYVDATGFRSLLLEGALGSPFLSYASSLFCDRAIVAVVPQRERVEPYTTAETMNAGWCWRIPVRGEDHRGYVHASTFLDEDAAIDEMRTRNPAMGEPTVVRFRSGRHRDFWLGNCVAVGNAYGFVEPLESTALHMVIVEIAHLVEVLRALERPHGEDPRSRASRTVAAHWDSLRWFLAVHYRFNRRSETEFWRSVRSDIDVSGISLDLERFRQSGPWLPDGAKGFAGGDPAFGYSGLMMLLLGQRAEGNELARASTSRAAWAAMVERSEAMVARAMSQADALEHLDKHLELLHEFVEAPTSWLSAEGRSVAELARA